MTNSILSCVWIKIYLTNQQYRSKILTLFCPQLFFLSLLCLCSITMTLNRPKKQYIFLLYKLYDIWMFNFSYQLLYVIRYFVNEKGIDIHTDRTINDIFYACCLGSMHSISTRNQLNSAHMLLHQHTYIEKLSFRRLLHCTCCHGGMHA